MGTRSVVARPTEDGGWKGRYIHWDGYPEGVGESLRLIIERDGLEAAARVLMDEHYGWSTVTGATEVELPEYMDDGRFVAVPGYGVAYTTEQGQSSPDDWFTDKTIGDSWCEWAYVLRDDLIAVYEVGFTHEFSLHSIIAIDAGSRKV